MVPRLRIVIADDEPLMRMFLEEILSESGHEIVAAAADGVELIEACRTLLPDLIITDLTMPRLGGREALEILAKERRAPALVLSGRNPEGNDAGSYPGPLKRLVKPVGAAEVLQAVESLFAGLSAAA